MKVGSSQAIIKHWRSQNAAHEVPSAWCCMGLQRARVVGLCLIFLGTLLHVSSIDLVRAVLLKDLTDLGLTAYESPVAEFRLFRPLWVPVHC